MKKIAAIGLTGFILLTIASILTNMLPSEAGSIRVLATILWPLSIVIIVSSLLFLIRDLRRRSWKLRREVTSLARAERESKPGASRRDPSSFVPIEAYKQSVVALARQLPRSNGSHHFKASPTTMVVVAPEPDELSTLFSTALYEHLSKHDISSADGLFILLDGRSVNEDAGDWLHTAFEAGIPIIAQLLGPLERITNIDLARLATAVYYPDPGLLEDIASRLGHDRIFAGTLGVDVTTFNPIGSNRYHLPGAVWTDKILSNNKEVQRDCKVILDELQRIHSLSVLDDSVHDLNVDDDKSSRPPGNNEITQRLRLNVPKLFNYAVHIGENKENQFDTGMALLNLQAQGIPILSNYTIATFNNAPWVRIVAERMNLSELFTGEVLRDADAMAQVALSSTMTERNRFLCVNDQLSRVGISRIGSRNEQILVVAHGELARVQEMVERQSYSNVSVIPRSQLDTVDLSDFGYVTVMSDKLDYGLDYLRGRFSAFIYTDTLIATQENGYRRGTFSDGRTHEFASIDIDPAVSLISTAHPDVMEMITGLCSGSVFDCYLVDHYQIDFGTFVKEDFDLDEVSSPVLSVIIPVHNNGLYLLFKAIPSLKTNKCFKAMEILLVDDGSDDSNTVAICEELSRTYPQIKVYRFEDGGSGSASRPRNYGLSVASAELITFLDPDNEISVGGYDRLIDRYQVDKEKNPNIEFVSGYQAKIAVRRAYTGKHTSAESETVDNFRAKFFNQGEFPVISTQAAVIARSFFDRTGLRFIESAIGQDTLFGWELILNAKAGTFVKDAFLLYYAERGGSVTNVVGSKYFERVLINERAKREVLEKHNLLDIYVESHLPKFVKTWYIPRLERVPQEQYEVARKNLEEIVQLYNHDLAEYEG